MRLLLPALFCGSLLLSFGCGDEVKSAKGETCSRTDDCEKGLKCINLTCIDTGVVDNSAACEAWKKSFSGKSCGRMSWDTILSNYPCSSYSAYTCDLAAFWKCMSDAMTCSGGVPDVNAMSACTSKVTCS